MKTASINHCTYYLPETIPEVLDLVTTAKENNQKIAVRGSGHSFPLVGANEENPGYMFIMLSYLNKITAFDKTKGIVTVQAGCHLGLDPFDPSHVSTLEKSLLYQLDPFDLKTGKRFQAPGWALPDLGGITHQTVGGFIATGSSGGATAYSFEDCVLSVDVAYHDKDGARIKTFTKPDNNDDDPFYGAGYANLGLMGIVVSVTMQCIPSFNIEGNEATSYYKDCEIDLFRDGDGRPTLEEFLKKRLYTRLMWWPQSTVQKMVVWQAHRTDAFKDWKDFKSQPYHEVPYVLGSPTPATLAADLIFTALGNWPNWLAHLFGNQPKTKEAIQNFADKLDPWLIKMILKVFEPVNTAKSPPQQFKDIWWNGLPMDNQMSDKLFPVWFTELWIPLDKTKDVMNDLKKFYEKNENSGTFSCEIYASGASKFWLSPSYGTDVIRIDVFWFAHNLDSPMAYYQHFWDELAQYDFRPHWGKYLPPHDGPQGVDYLKKRYSDTWDKWQDLRRTMDPHNLFLTTYWSDHLGIDT